MAKAKIKDMIKHDPNQLKIVVLNKGKYGVFHKVYSGRFPDYREKNALFIGNQEDCNFYLKEGKTLETVKAKEQKENN